MIPLFPGAVLPNINYNMIGYISAGNYPLKLSTSLNFMKGPLFKRDWIEKLSLDVYFIWFLK